MPQPKKRARKDVSESEGSEYASDEHSEVEIVDSDALDEETPPPTSSAKKRGRESKNSPAKKNKGVGKKVESPGKNGKGVKPKKASSSSKKRKREDSDEDEDGDDKFEVVGTIVPAPTTGMVPAGQISKNTLNFLKKLQDPKCNDREWFKLHDPVFRQAEKEWTDFVEEFTNVLTEVDDEIPHLPPKDLVHRIYRDVRFSNDKTPYKTNFSASFSRTGRKGIFAHYHISVKPGGSIFAAGSWCPGKNELEQIRTHIKRNPLPLREAISDPTFVSLFGPATWSKDKRQNIFGAEDQLKVAPKGVAKDHPSIDLLKCRSFAVVHRLTDEQVLSKDFKDILGAVAEGAKPFVHRLNHMMTIGVEDDDEAADSS